MSNVADGDVVGIRLVTDLRPVDGSGPLMCGSELVVQAATAAGLILCGAAVKLPRG